MKSAKKIFLFALSIFLSSFAFAQNTLTSTGHASNATSEPWFDLDSVHHLFLSGTGNSNTGFETYIFSYQLGYTMDSKYFSGTLGMHVGPEDGSVSGEAILWPLRFRLLRMGLGTGVNFRFMSDIAFEMNLLPGFYIEFRPFRFFMFTAHTNYMFKGRTIYSIQDYEPLLVNHTAAIGVKFHFIPKEGIDIYLGADSTEFFRYMIAVAPTFTLGVTFTVGRFTFLVEENARYIDFFTLSSCYEGSEVRLLMEMRL